MVKEWAESSLLKVLGKAQARRASLRPWAWKQGRLAQEGVANKGLQDVKEGWDWDFSSTE